MSNISEVLSIGVSEGVSGYSAWVSDDPNGTDPGTPCDPAHPPHDGECRWKCGGNMLCDSSGANDCGCCVSDLSVPECTLLGGTEQNLVQAFCALTGFCSLVLKKRFLDDKKGGVQRGWKVWGMDVTKQGTSGVAAHVAGIVNSYLLNDADDGGNACSWYFISFTFDTTLGVIIGYILLHLLQEASKKAEWSSLQATGNYKRTSTTMSAAGQGCVEKDWCPTGVDGMVWFKQMISWCLITLVARAFVGCVLFLNRSWLVHIARVVAEPFTCEPTVLLVLVMLGCPLCLNALQLWVQDQFLKDADGSESKFDKWSKRCCGRGGGSEATDPLLPAGTQAGAFSTERIPTGFSSQNIQNIKGISDGRQPSGSASLYSSE